ncbi:hypothetical protein Harreka1_53 [Olleya phage Harreka_1]|uniref:Uncharacterized protein n=1 Tax=Olleya phage Harreka_1 TaxID=2745673 RepID=A0A8E5E8S9_9CAUD|nr:hypothetical protein M1M26_gp53 [Olleya phage Harreka_1]QQV90460.1 hypothetical protein Harreka1_53 [Olleya phage Harreka_1]
MVRYLIRNKKTTNNMKNLIKTITGTEDKTTNTIATIGLLVIVGLILTFIVLAFNNGIQNF